MITVTTLVALEGVNNEDHLGGMGAGWERT